MSFFAFPALHKIIIFHLEAKMKKLFSALLAAVLVAGSAISASAGMFIFDSSDSEYWDAALNMLDKTQKVFWMEDGAAADWSISVDANSVEYDTNKLSNLESGWYESFSATSVPTPNGSRQT